MKLCHHPNIVGYEGYSVSTISPKSKMRLVKPQKYLIMEYCDGGDLDKYVACYRQKKQLLGLKLVGNLFSQIAEGQKYLHFEKGFVHRDIKLENFLLIKHEPYPIVKLCDFGFGTSIRENMETFIGTPLFASPQIIQNVSYDSKSDLYSIGVCLYLLATTHYPFKVKSYDELYNLIKENNTLEFPDEIKDNKEYEDIINLIRKLMAHYDKDRISWEEFYEDKYMKEVMKK